MYQEETEQQQNLQTVVEELADESSKLEALSLSTNVNPTNNQPIEEEFYDAVCSLSSNASSPSLTSGNSLHSFDSFEYCPACENGVSSDIECDCSKYKFQKNTIGPTSCSSSSVVPGGGGKTIGNTMPKKERRTSVPAKAEHGFTLWSIIKHCIGKDLTKIPLPVYFNEPLSTLQRLTEEYEYAELLHKAAQCKDSCQQLVYVTAFVIASYSNSSKRTGKPFNPLLGETFECDRMEDLGWKCISEQVSHHPPILAQHCEGQGWVAWQEFSMTTKLKGTSLLVNPLGINHLEFPRTGHHYTWNKVSTTVHNLIVGTLWLDHHGEIQVKNHTTGDECVVQFSQYKYFSSETYRKVSGIVRDNRLEPCWVLHGTWDHKLKAARVLSVDDERNLKTEDPETIWERIPLSVEDGKRYNMTVLACQLNEPEKDIAPTDSRLRPDQRLMEDGKWEEANQTKTQLEEKQRRKRKLFEGIAEKAAAEGQRYIGHSPAWFERKIDPVTRNPIHLYAGEYWDCKATQDWSRCPDIFL